MIVFPCNMPIKWDLAYVASCNKSDNANNNSSYINYRNDIENLKMYKSAIRQFSQFLNSSLYKEQWYQEHMAALSAIQIALTYSLAGKDKLGNIRSNHAKSMLFDYRDLGAKVQKHLNRTINDLAYDKYLNILINKIYYYK